MEQNSRNELIKPWLLAGETKRKVGADELLATTGVLSETTVGDCVWLEATWLESDVVESPPQATRAELIAATIRMPLTEQAICNMASRRLSAAF